MKNVLIGRSKVAEELNVSVATASRMKRRGILRVRQLRDARNSIWVVDRDEVRRLRGAADE